MNPYENQENAQDWGNSENPLLIPSTEPSSLAQHVRGLPIQGKIAVAIQATRVNIIHVQPALFDAWIAEHEK